MPNTISATEAKNSLGKYLDASQKEPITIEKMGRPFAVLVSQEDFESLHDAAARNELNGRKSEAKYGFAATGDHSFQGDDEQWLSVKKSFDRLMGDCDGTGLLPPSSKSIDYAWRLVTSIYLSACRRRKIWVAPHVGVDEFGSVTLEWWYEARKLTFYVEGNGNVTFLKSWGSNIHEQMDDGIISSIDDFVRLSKWLFQGSSK